MSPARWKRLYGSSTWRNYQSIGKMLIPQSTPSGKEKCWHRSSKRTQQISPTASTGASPASQTPGTSSSMLGSLRDLGTLDNSFSPFLKCQKNSPFCFLWKNLFCCCFSLIFIVWQCKRNQEKGVRFLVGRRFTWLMLPATTSCNTCFHGTVYWFAKWKKE